MYVVFRFWRKINHFRGNRLSMSRDRLAKLKTEVLEQAGFIQKGQQNNIIHAKNKILRLHSKIYHPPIGHLRDGAILLLLPESFSVLLSSAN